MPVKIRLMRIGAKKRPFYRVVAVDEKKKRTGGYLELLGTYNPLTEPKEINLNQERIDAWVKNGAQYSDGFLRIIGKAPQKPPRKPKKQSAPPELKPEQKVADTPSEQQPAENTKEDQTPNGQDTGQTEDTTPNPAAETAPVEVPTEETTN